MECSVWLPWLLQHKCQAQIETHCFAITMIVFSSGMLSVLMAYHLVRANLVIPHHHDLNSFIEPSTKD